ncbi:hypothetical protein Ddye_013917 [Dipteronia dyeriana]|uniref:F-box domain-containing protein n=1 Tax=Dipteronia dyeriana TaxID=168575 RepID=A0AAD9X701_9ROSI|nr:hypothetical protein Ddye_013917 [Dipteronia dyeriana]
MRTRIDEVDRISELPDPILHHILSFLPLKQVAWTCVLSKKWEKTWRTYPVFKIDESTLCQYEWREPERRVKLLNYLEQTLRNHHIKGSMSMEKFSIETKLFGDIETKLFGDKEYVSFVDRCICYAIENNVKKLKLGILSKIWYEHEFGLRRASWYDLPPIVLCSNSIEVLKLRGCKLELSNVKLPSLRRLHLLEVYSNSRVINNLLVWCPLIEDIVISNCSGIASLELFGLERLNDIMIANNKELKLVDMEKLNVSSLSVVQSSSIVQSLSFVQPLTILFVINVTFCTNLKNLRFVEAYIKDEWLCKLISELTLLECLELRLCNKLKSVKISSTSLKTFSIFRCTNVVKLEIDTHKLTHFTYDGGMMVLFCRNALALSYVDLSLSWTNLDTDWNAKFIELLVQFHKCSVILSLRVSKNEEFIVSKELRQMLPSPLSRCKHLNLCIKTISLLFSIAKVVDELLWIAPHIKTLSIEYSLSDAFKKIYFEFSYKKPLVYEEEISSCGESLPISCWQYCIEKVKLEFNGYKGNSTKVCSLEGGEFLEKIDGLCGRLNV